MTEDPELADLVRSALPIDPADGTIVVGYDHEGLPKWGDPKVVIAAVLAALSDRLVPPGSIGRTEWLVTGKRRQQYPCFDEAEARSVAQMTGGRIRTRQTMAWPGGAVYASGWKETA